MATKLSNSHLSTIMENSKCYNILDVYISLAHISSEVKGKFLIQTYTDNKADLINLIKRYVNVSYRTIHNNILELINLGILDYNDELSAWTLVNMENMVQVKSNQSSDSATDCLGYVYIRDFFLSNTFQSMKFAEKRCIIYLSQLRDSKAATSYSEFMMNLSKKSSAWLKLLKTNSKYYARNIVINLLNKYNDIFTNTSEKFRANDLAPKTITEFKFSFTCSEIEQVKSDDSDYKLVKVLNTKEFNLVQNKIKFANITLSKTQVMHIVRSISTIKEWFLKERIVQIIINKYIAIQIHHSRENIKSLPAYLVAVTKAVIKEFNDFKATVLSRGKDLETSYSDSDIFTNDIAYNSIKEILNLI